MLFLLQALDNSFPDVELRGKVEGDAVEKGERLLVAKVPMGEKSAAEKGDPPGPAKNAFKTLLANPPSDINAILDIAMSAGWIEYCRDPVEKKKKELKEDVPVPAEVYLDQLKNLVQMYRSRETLRFYLKMAADVKGVKLEDVKYDALQDGFPGEKGVVPASKKTLMILATATNDQATLRLKKKAAGEEWLKRQCYQSDGKATYGILILRRISIISSSASLPTRQALDSAFKQERLWPQFYPDVSKLFPEEVGVRPQYLPQLTSRFRLVISNFNDVLDELNRKKEMMDAMRYMPSNLAMSSGPVYTASAYDYQESPSLCGDLRAGKCSFIHNLFTQPGIAKLKICIVCCILLLGGPPTWAMPSLVPSLLLLLCFCRLTSLVVLLLGQCPD